MHILVTGGAGYIGSHLIPLLLDLGYKVTVIDNLSTGSREALPNTVNFIVGDVCDSDLMLNVFSKEKIDVVIHLAGKTVVSESIKKPAEYYENNVGGTVCLIKTCHVAKVKKIIFSSTAAVYGESNSPVTEQSQLNPINPYGKSKLMAEEILRDAECAYGIRSVCLRYFNVAGASVSGSNGQRSFNASHLIKVSAEAAVGRRSQVYLFGDDYPTIDGTCIRDYIHVEDIADLHVFALDYLLKGKPSDVFNCGYGVGYSVKQVLETMQKATNSHFKIKITGRREGDPAILVANSDKAKKVLGWQPRFNDIHLICKTAYEWERSLTV